MSGGSDEEHDSEVDPAETAATVAAIPKEAAARQRKRRTSGVALSTAGLPVLSDERYEIGEEVARGGVGKIVAAFDRHLKRNVALKELAVRTTQSEARFGREARLTAQLEHPAIIPVHDARVWPTGRPFYVMKLVDGSSLAATIDATRDFDGRIALLSNIIDVAEAVAYAHSQRIIHRDLKPSNVLVGSFGETVVIDWGLAKDLGETESPSEGMPPSAAEHSSHYDTRVGAVLGTPAYMSPEQAAGDDVDERTDVYALGALLYHVLTGQRPYRETAAKDLLGAVASQPPADISEIEPSVPSDLRAIVDKAMRRNRDERYRNAGELAEELRRFANGQLVGAHRYSSRELLMRFVARQRRVLIAVGVSLLILLGASVWGVIRIANERTRAEQAAAAEETERKNAEGLARRAETLRLAAVAQTQRLLLSQARLLLESDPTRAVSTLKLLGETSPQAASIAAEAEELGVARHVLDIGDRQPVRAVAVSDSWVAWSNEAGVIAIDRRGERHEMALHGGLRVSTLAVADQGHAVVSGGHDGSLLWVDTATMKARTIATLDEAVIAAAVSPGAETVAAIGRGGRFGEWSASGTPIDRAQMNMGRSAFLQYSDDGRFLLSGPHGDEVVVREASTRRRWELDHDSATPRAADFDGSGDRLATIAGDGILRVFATSGGPPLVRLAVPDAMVLRFSRDGRWIAVGDMNGGVSIIDWRERQVRKLGAHSERVTDIDFVLQGAAVASVSWDKTARIWSLESSTYRVLMGHGDVVSDLAVSRDGTTLVTGSWDTTVRVWKLLEPMEQVFSGHRVGVKAVAISPDGKRVASGAHDNEVRVWNVADGRPRLLRGHSDHVFRVLFSPGGDYLASSSDDTTVRLWRMDGQGHRVLRGHRADVEEMAFAPNGLFLASAAEDDTARIWSVGNDNLSIVLAGHRGPITAIDISSDSQHIVTSSTDTTVRLWASNGNEVETWRGHGGDVFDVAFSSSDDGVYSIGADATLRRWRVSERKGVILASGLDGARILEISPAGRWAAVAGIGGALWLCRLPGGECTPLVGHHGTVRDLAFAADGLSLVSAGSDNLIRIWDVNTRASRALRGHLAPIFDVAISADGQYIVSGSGDGTVRRWRLRRPPHPDAVGRIVGEMTSLSSD